MTDIPYEMEDLPYEIVLESLLRLDPVSLQYMCRVNRYYADICRDDIFWKRKVRIDYPDEKLEAPLLGSQKQTWVTFLKQRRFHFKIVLRIEEHVSQIDKLRDTLSKVKYDFRYIPNEAESDIIKYHTENGIKEMIPLNEVSLNSNFRVHIMGADMYIYLSKIDNTKFTTEERKQVYDAIFWSIIDRISLYPEPPFIKFDSEYIYKNNRGIEISHDEYMRHRNPNWKEIEFRTLVYVVPEIHLSMLISIPGSPFFKNKYE